jgi:glycosyltransferase involved in cell wall biosynthesis
MNMLQGKKVLCIMPIPIIPLIGTSIRCMRQVQGLISKGASVTLLCPEIMVPGGSGKLNDPFFENVDVRPVFPNRRNPIMRELSTLLQSRRIIQRVMEELRPDIVHVHNPPDTMPFVTSLACRALRIPMIYDVHDAALETFSAVEFNPFLKYIYLKVSLFFEKRAALGSRGILFVSRTAKESFIATRPYMKSYPDANIVIMMNTDPAYAEIRIDPDQQTGDFILYSGTLYSNFLGLEEFIVAFDEAAKDTGTTLLIAGDGPYKPRLQKFIEERGMKDRVIFLGFLDRWDLRERIRRAMFCTIPYRNTLITSITLPHKVFEYMAYGKAIVHPDFPGFEEVLGSENTGKFHSGNRQSLVASIKAFIADKGLRDTTGMMNRHLLSAITFEKELGKMTGLYENLLGRKG